MRRQLTEAATAAFVLLAAAPCFAAAVTPLQHGLVLRPENDDGSGFPYVWHTPSASWVGQECQLRVSAERTLPEPLAPPRQKPLLEVVQFGGLTIETARIVGGIGNVQHHETWRWWWIDKSIGDVELARPQRLSVQVFWSGADAATRRAEPLELFELPRIDALPLAEWTPWRRAESVHRDEDARFAIARGDIPRRGWFGRSGRDAEPPSNGFELRCRAQRWETPYRRQRR
jgi:hypothetical protein